MHGIKERGERVLVWTKAILLVAVAVSTSAEISDCWMRYVCQNET